MLLKNAKTIWWTLSHKHKRVFAYCFIETFLIEIKLIDRTFEEETQLIKNYIDDLFIAGNLEEKSPDDYLEINDSYGGYQYYYSNNFGDIQAKNYFDKIRKYIDKKQDEILFNKYNHEYILSSISNNSPEIYDIISKTPVPILKNISPKEFVDIWIKNPPKDRYKLKQAPENRIVTSRNYEFIEEEAEWIINTLDEINKHISEAKGFELLRLKSLIPTGYEYIKQQMLERQKKYQ